LRRVGFIVDDIVREQVVVRKDLVGSLGDVPCVAGVTILGTGEVALILDVPNLLWKLQGAWSKGHGGDRLS
jgi:two-component system chemotaxis sensor kinase CheA